MKRITVIKMMISSLALIIMLTSCSSKISSQSSVKSTAKPSTNKSTTSDPVNNNEAEKLAVHSTIVLKPYDNVGYLLQQANKYTNKFVFEQNQYRPEDIHTYSFDDKIIFKGSEALASQILEEGKNPGLGINNLHKQGITGKNVNVAIIDQNMLTDNPEFTGRIVAYYDSGCKQPKDSGSYHGPSVTSILAGKTIGVAPEANVYYAAAPSWEKDAKYFADCLNWIIKQNNTLPKSQKIRVVSVSSAPTSADNWYKNGELWEKAVAEAQKDGILVIDCRSRQDVGQDTAFVFSSYCNLADKDDVSKYKPGYPNADVNNGDNYSDEYSKSVLFAPASLRTCAQEYATGIFSYRYDGSGGQSWAIPYVSGVLALGWQVNPNLDGKTMKSLLFQTSWVNVDGLHFINPPAFINAVRKAH